jgi:hypothetical protein
MKCPLKADGFSLGLNGELSKSVKLVGSICFAGIDSAELRPNAERRGGLAEDGIQRPRSEDARPLHSEPIWVQIPD